MRKYVLHHRISTSVSVLSTLFLLALIITLNNVKIIKTDQQKYNASNNLSADINKKNSWQIVSNSDEYLYSSDNLVRVKKYIDTTDIENNFIVNLIAQPQITWTDFFESTTLKAVHNSSGSTNSGWSYIISEKDFPNRTDINKEHDWKSIKIKLTCNNEIISEYNAYIDFTDVKNVKSGSVVISNEIFGLTDYLIQKGVSWKDLTSTNNLTLEMDITSFVPNYDFGIKPIIFNNVEDGVKDYIYSNEGNDQSEVIDKTYAGEYEMVILPDGKKSAYFITDAWYNKYSITLDTSKDYFLSSGNPLSTPPSNAIYNVDNNSKLIYNNNQEINFPIPKIKGVLYDFNIYKIDENKLPLSGSAFTIYDENNNIIKKTSITDKTGLIDIENITSGKIIIEETTIPKGYFKPTNDTEISLSYTENNLGFIQSPLNPANLMPKENNGRIEIINKRDHGTLMIIMESENIPENNDFTIKIKIKKEDGSNYLNELEIVHKTPTKKELLILKPNQNNEFIITLKKDESIFIDELKERFHYEIIEENNDNYLVTYNINGNIIENTSTTGIIDIGIDQKIIINNTLKSLSLPSTGGHGKKGIFIVGIILINIDFFILSINKRYIFNK